MIYVVAPCFFDISSFLNLRSDILTSTQFLANAHGGLKFILIDDSAGADSRISELSSFNDTTVLSCPFNLGHQSALVYALRALCSSWEDDDLIVTMDSDGEDRAEDIPHLLAPLLKQEKTYDVSLAQRTKREEGLLFKIFYSCFKLFFLSMTGTIIKNGNFVAAKAKFLKRVIFHPHFNYVYSSSFISIPMRLTYVPLPRGKRYDGQSKMGTLGLLTHGIRMLMPFAGRICVKSMVFFSTLIPINFLAVVVLGLFFHHKQVTIALGIGLLAPMLIGLGLSFLTFLVLNGSYYARFYDINRLFAADLGQDNKIQKKSLTEHTR